MPLRSVIRSIGHYAPSKILTNADLEKIVDTTEEWIVQRTGMRERRVAAETETTSDIGANAAKLALKKGGFSPEDIDMIVCGTVTPDMMFPSTSCLIQAKIGAKNAGALDVGAACAGFIYSLSVADGLLVAGTAKRVLVVGADALTKFVDYTSRDTCVLFGDGGGAVVMELADEDNRGIISTALMADGNGAVHIEQAVGGSRNPSWDEKSKNAYPYIFMAGKEVYRFAVGAMGDACQKVLDQAGMHASDVDLFVPHQANMRIIESAAKRLDIPKEKVFINIEKYGNTSGGSIPLALAEAEEAGALKKGMVAMTVGFGAGLVWGANLIRW